MGTRRRRPRRRRRRPLHRTQRRRRSPESPTSPESPGRQCRRRRRRRHRHRHRRQTTEQPLPSRRSRQVGWVAAAGWEAVVAWEAEEGWEGREAVAPALPPTSPSSRPPGKPPPAGSAPSDAERPHPSWAPRASVLRACLRRTRKAGMQEEPSGNYFPGVTPHDSLTTHHTIYGCGTGLIGEGESFVFLPLFALPSPPRYTR